MTVLTTQRSRLPHWGLGAAVVAVASTVVLSAPQPPELDEASRWFVIALAGTNCAWNIYSAVRAFRATGPVSLVGFLHLWVFFAFSFPAAEMTYRYDSISLGFWQVFTTDPALLQATILLFGFQVVFFLALGKGVDKRCADLVRRSQRRMRQERVAIVFLVLLLPLVAARLLVLRGLGISGAATAAVTRTDYFAQLDSGVSPIVWALNAAFPVYAVILACLAVKFMAQHPSTLGRWLFVSAIVGCAGGVALSGGRAEIVFITVMVGVSMYASGYRTTRHYAPLIAAGLALAVFLFAVGQARHGEENALSQAADGSYVGDDYSGGDITQILGLGRFDAVVMILDKHDRSDALDGTSYARSLSAGLDTTFLPQITAGIDLDPPTVSGSVLGRWVFGAPTSSALPSAAGEGYLNFGYLGVMMAALGVGWLARGLTRLAARVPGPPEATVVLMMWTMARLLSDESALVATFAARNWPVLLVVIVVLRVAGEKDGSIPTLQKESSR